MFNNIHTSQIIIFAVIPIARISIPVIIVVFNVQVIIFLVVVLVITLLQTHITLIQSTDFHEQTLNIYAFD